MMQNFFRNDTILGRFGDDLLDLGENSPTVLQFLKIGVGTAENEPINVADW